MLSRTLSVVTPFLNEAGAIAELWQRLYAVLEGTGLRWEVIFVDDGSTDGSTALVRDICRVEPRVRLLRLSRNFGHQPALTAGLDCAMGDAVILMDADLQDRPEAIADLVREWQGGTQVVYAVRASRRESWLLRTAFKGFYRVLGRMSRLHLPADAGIFGLLDRAVVNVLKSMPERNRYFPGLRAYAGFTQKGVSVPRDARFSGASRVHVSGLIRLALDGLVAFSFVPLRLCTFAGLVVSAGAFAYIVRILYKKWVSLEAIPGWASTLTAILFLGGLQLLMLGVLGEYVGRIYEEVKGRPYYIVAEKINVA